MDTLQIIRHYLNEQHEIPPDTITPASKLDEIGIDSFAFLGLVFEFESRFGINAPDKEISNIQTIGELITLLEKYTPGKK